MTPTLPTLNRIAAATGRTLTITLTDQSTPVQEDHGMTVTIGAPVAPVMAGERAQRQHLVADAIHSTAMEGVPVTQATQADLHRWADGQISFDTLMATVVARYDHR